MYNCFPQRPFNPPPPFEGSPIAVSLATTIRAILTHTVQGMLEDQWFKLLEIGYPVDDDDSPYYAALHDEVQKLIDQPSPLWWIENQHRSLFHLAEAQVPRDAICQGDRSCMMALSLMQPWASLVVSGAKRIETRSWWAPRHLWGERIAIHASQRFYQVDQELCDREPFATALKAAGLHRRPKRYDSPFPLATWGKTLPRGAVIGTARLLCCFEITREPSYLIGVPGNLTEYRRIAIDETERAFGCYAPGRVGWVLADPEQFPAPIKAKGALGLWNWG